VHMCGQMGMTNVL